MKHQTLWRKRCANCMKTRESDMFHTSRYSKDGLTGICRICLNETSLDAATGRVVSRTAVCACGRKLAAAGTVNCGRILCREGAI